MTDNAAPEPRADESGLPYVDEHRTTIEASPELVWTALRRYADSSLGVAGSHPLARMLGTEPPGGFEVAREVPNQHLSLSGRHRFSRYQLVFDLTAVTGGQTLLSARTYAVFPGPHGRIYRALVIGTRGHVVAVKHMLRCIRRASLEPTSPAAG
jgi:hypothetical protein